MQTIQDLQQKQEKSLNEIQLKLKEMNQVKEIFKITNLFKPNLYSFSQNSTFLVGSIKLNEYCSYKNSFERSRILTGEQQCLELLKAL